MSTRGVDPERPRCPGKCGCLVPAGRLMCKACWDTVPKPERLAAMKTLNAWLAYGTRELWRDHLDAREAAHAAADPTVKCDR